MSRWIVVFSFFAPALDLYSGDVRTALLHDGPGFALGTLLTAIGILAITLFRVRKKGTDRGLLWFGLFTSLYGLRLIFSADLFRFALEPIPPLFWIYLAAAITYLILLLIALFLRELFPAWRRVLRWVTWGLAFFAITGIVADQILHQPTSLYLVNNLIVITGVVGLLWALYRDKTGSQLQPLRVGSLIFFVTVLFTNVWTIYRRTFPTGLDLVEPVGFTCFLAGVGTVVIRGLFEREEQFIEVSKELDIARRIQTSILPRQTPSSSLLSLSARYIAMTAVAGDFYDFLVLDENRVGILIADVSGHGVPAALIASMVKVAIAAQLPCADDPAQVLTGMNRILCGKVQSQFVSAAYLFLDLQNGWMRYAGAGHPPLLYCQHEAVESISENGLLLGLFPSASYTVLERKLVAGSRYLLYTDGMVEASNTAEQFFGEERLREVLQGTRNLNAEESATTLVDRVQAWAGARQQDDLTVIVVDIHRPFVCDRVNQ
jgi:phosphoserine phosphatase RsbU/P